MGEEWDPTSCRKLLRRHATVGPISLLLLVVGLGLGFLWASHWPASVPTLAPWVQLASGWLFLWGVLGLMGWEIQTLGGEARQEKWNVLTFRVLNCAGMLLLFSSSAALIFAGR